MSQDQIVQDSPDQEEREDRLADGKAILIIFGTLVVMAVHFVSGFTFDF